MIKTVIFDIDGVLIDSFNANFKFFFDLMAKFGYSSLNREQFSALFHIPMKDIIRIVTKSTDEEEIEKIWKAGKDKEVPYPHELLNTPKHLNKTLKVLNENYILGIVTSRIHESIFSLSSLAELEDYFKVVVAYQDTENHKPHPEPLLLFAQKLKVLPEECVYIGDAESDLLAARAAGMKVIIYSKNQFNQADAWTSSFTKLQKLILSLND